VWICSGVKRGFRLQGRVQEPGSRHGHVRKSAARLGRAHGETGGYQRSGVIATACPTEGCPGCGASQEDRCGRHATSSKEARQEKGRAQGEAASQSATSAAATESANTSVAR